MMNIQLNETDNAQNTNGDTAINNANLYSNRTDNVPHMNEDATVKKLHMQSNELLGEASNVTQDNIEILNVETNKFNDEINHEHNDYVIEINTGINETNTEPKDTDTLIHNTLTVDVNTSDIVDSIPLYSHLNKNLSSHTVLDTEYVTCASSSDDHCPVQDAELQPPDGGWGWVCVFCRFYVRFLCFGVINAFGVIYVRLIESFQSGRGRTAWVGSIAAGLVFFVGPLAGWLTDKYDCRKVTITGALIASTGLAISAFSSSLHVLYVSYGVMTGVGLGISLIPTIVIVMQYFERRRGLANGLSSLGSGVATLVLPPLFGVLVDTYDWRGTLLIMSGLCLNCVVCGAMLRPPPHIRKLAKISSNESYLKPNRPVGVIKNYTQLLKNKRYLLVILSAFFVFLGYSVPYVHLPDFAASIGIPALKSSTLVSLMGVTNLVSRPIYGLLCDHARVKKLYLLALCLCVCGVATVMSPLCTSFPLLTAYALVQGSFIGAFGQIITLVVTETVGNKNIGNGIGLCFVFQGISVSLASPLSGWLFDLTGNYHASFWLAGLSFLAAAAVCCITEKVTK